MDIRKIRYNRMEKKYVDDPTCNLIINNKKALNETILTNTKFKKQDQIQAHRLRTMKPFSDFDKDKIPNIVDRRPTKKDKSFWNMLK